MSKKKAPDWDSIIGSIMEENCVLFLGPQVTEKGQSLLDEFLKDLYTQSKQKPDSQNDIVAYHQSDGFLLFAENKRTKYSFKIKRFYEQTFAKSMFAQVAQMPFRVIVSLTPDLSLYNTFNDLNIPCNYEFFDKREKKDLLEIPTKDKPLIYSLFGSIKDSNTLIISHQDLFEYLKALFSNDLPVNLRDILKKSSYFIFLGCQFEKWYFQLLANLLKLDKSNIMQSALNLDLNEEAELLCNNQLKIEFITGDIINFVNELYVKFGEYDGEYRKPKTIKPKRNWNLESIRNFLNEAFSAEDMIAFCQMYFYEAYNQFGQGMLKTAQITLLIDYLVRNDLLDKFLEYAEKTNATQFEAYKPYFS